MALSPNIDEFARIRHRFWRVKDVFKGFCLVLGVPWCFIPIPFGVGQVWVIVVFIAFWSTAKRSWDTPISVGATFMSPIQMTGFFLSRSRIYAVKCSFHTFFASSVCYVQLDIGKFGKMRRGILLDLDRHLQHMSQ
jgi:hypothetical protein